MMRTQNQGPQNVEETFNGSSCLPCGCVFPSKDQIPVTGTSELSSHHRETGSQPTQEPCIYNHIPGDLLNVRG